MPTGHCPLPVHDAVTQYGDEAAATLMTAAIGRRDKPALERMAAAMLDTGRAGPCHARSGKKQSA